MRFLSLDEFSGKRRHACMIILLGLLAFPSAAAASDADERLRLLEEKMMSMQQEILALRTELIQATREQGQRDEQLSLAVAVLGEELEHGQLEEVSSSADSEGLHGLGPAASKVYAVKERGVSIGGYGEMLYESFSSTLDDGTRSSKTDQLDYLRGVLYFGYKFNEHFLFNSEIEYEHAIAAGGEQGTGNKGSVGVEMAALDFLWKDEVNLRAGMLLAPMGFINELHEPPVYLGARRPEVEQAIIPTTWRENGFGVFGGKGIFSYRAYLLAGFDASKFGDSKPLRSGRQKGSKSKAEDFGLAVRFDFEPLPGLLLGASGYFGDSGQGIALDGKELDVATTLYDVHVDFRHRGLQLRGLYTEGTIDDVAELNEILEYTGNDSIPERFDGWYLEAGFDLLAHRGTEQELIPYVRYEEIDSQARVPLGFERNPKNERNYLTFGIAYKPHPQIVLKADWRNEDNGADTGQDQFSVALGFLF